MYYYDSGKRLSYIPEAWTDLVAPEPLDVLPTGAVLFRVEDLLRLVDRVESLAEGSGDAECQGDSAAIVKRNLP